MKHDWVNNGWCQAGSREHLRCANEGCTAAYRDDEPEPTTECPEREVVLPQAKHITDALKSFERHGDPVNTYRIAHRVERRNRNVGPFTLDDIDSAAMEAVKLGLVERVEISNYLGYKLTEAGVESD